MSNKTDGLTDAQIAWFVNMTEQAELMAQALGVSVPKGMEALLHAQRITARAGLPGPGPAVSLATMPTNGTEPS